MPRPRLLVFMLATASIAACAAAPTAPPTRMRAAERALRDGDPPPPCDSLHSGYTNPNGRC